MDETFAVHPLPDTGLVEQVDGRLLEHAGANAAEHVFAGLALDDDIVDAGLVQAAARAAGRRGLRR